MKPTHLVSWLVCVLLTACGGGELVSMSSKMDVEIINQSSRDLQNALARFGDYDCKLGYVGKTFTAGYGFFPHPITPDTELHWDEDEGQAEIARPKGDGGHGRCKTRERQGPSHECSRCY